MLVKGKLAPNFSSGKIDFTLNGQQEKRELVKAGSADWMLLKSFKLHRLVPIVSEGEKLTAVFDSLNGVTVEEVILTKEPWVLLRNREYPVKQ